MTVVTRGRGVALLVAAIAAAFAACGPGPLLVALRGLPWLVPTTWAWDLVHAAHDTFKGQATWHAPTYDRFPTAALLESEAAVATKISDMVKRLELRDAEFSVLDVGCQNAHMLAMLGKKHATAQLYGTDVSRQAIERRARGACPRCRLAVLDLAIATSTALSASWHSLDAAAYPDEFDFVVVSDVLIYLPLAGWPPALWAWKGGVLPRSWVAPAQDRIIAALRRAARRNVVLSSHQDNPAVEEWMHRAGAQKVKIFTSKLTGRSTSGGGPRGVYVWVLPGASKS